MGKIWLRTGHTAANAAMKCVVERQGVPTLTNWSSCTSTIPMSSYWHGSSTSNTSSNASTSPRASYARRAIDRAQAGSPARRHDCATTCGGVRGIAVGYDGMQEAGKAGC